MRPEACHAVRVSEEAEIKEEIFLFARKLLPMGRLDRDFKGAQGTRGTLPRWLT
jgi:hypothetical protein